MNGLGFLSTDVSRTAEMLQPWRIGLTFGLAMLSAMVFLSLRCHGRGRVLGRRSRGPALAIVVLTGIVSASGAIVLGLVADQYLGIVMGAIAPSGLWLSQMRRRETERRSPAIEAATFWLVSLLARLDQGMVEDQRLWCEERVDDEWSVHELSQAANRYHERIAERLSPQERQKERVHARLQAIERRLDVAAMIEDGAPRSKVGIALGGSRHTKQARYERYLNDLTRLQNILRHDAQSELVRLLAAGYKSGYLTLSPYMPPLRIPVNEPPRPHP